MNKLITAAAVAAIACGCITVNKNDGGESDLRMKVCKDVIHEKVSVDKEEVSGSNPL